MVKEDMLTIKYYEYEDITGILKPLGLNIKEEYGYYDKRAIKDGEEMIFVCTNIDKKEQKYGNTFYQEGNRR